MKIKTLRCKHKLWQTTLADQMGVRFQKVADHERDVDRLGSAERRETPPARDLDARDSITDASCEDDAATQVAEFAASDLSVRADVRRTYDALRRLPDGLRTQTLRLITVLADRLADADAAPTVDPHLVLREKKKD